MKARDDAKSTLSLTEVVSSLAVIGLLTAILFPVLHQTGISTKKDDSMKNGRSIIFAAFLYSVGHDDYAMPITTWGDRDAPITVSGVGMKPWTTLVQPYLPKADALIDPQGPGVMQFGGIWTDDLTKRVQPQYGYNYLTFDDLNLNTRQHFTIPWGSVTHPELTAALASKNSRLENTGLSSPAGFWGYGTGTFNLNMAVQQPYCNSAVQCCTSFWATTVNGLAVLGNSQRAGAFTGQASMRGDGTIIVIWADGHVSAERWQRMVTGTNVTQSSPGVWLNLDNDGVVITDASQYVWDAD